MQAHLSIMIMEFWPNVVSHWVQSYSQIHLEVISHTLSVHRGNYISLLKEHLHWSPLV